MDVRRAIRRVPLGARVGGLAVAALLGVAAGADASPALEPSSPAPVRPEQPAAIAAPAPDWIADAGVPDHAGGGRTATNARGDILLAWGDEEGVWASVRPAGGSWGRRQRLSAPGEVAGVAGAALDADGDGVVAWTAAPDPGAPQVVSTVRAASLRAGEWEPAQTLFEGPPAGGIPFAGSVQATFLAGAPDGRALAVWTASGTGVMWSERAPGGAWSPAAVVPGAPPWVRALAVDAAGNAVIVADDSWLGEGRLVVQERPAGGAWSAPAPLGPSAEARFGDLVVAPSGAAAISWKDRTGGILLAERPAGGSWGAPTEVGRGFESDLALGPGGELVLSSTGLELDDPSAPFAMQMRVRSRGPGGAWGPSEILTAPCWNALRPSVVVDAHGDAIAMWIAHDRGTGRMVQFAVRPAGGTWSPSRTLDVSIWEPFSLTAAGDGELLFLRGAMPWGPLPALTLPHDRWTEPAAEGLACAPMPDADDRTRPIDVIGDPGPNGPQADAVTTETRATPPVARNLRIVRSGRRAVVAFTLPRPSRVRATVHRTGRRIARLPDRRMAPGGRTLRLGSLPPGRYRLVLELTGAEGSARITRTFRLGPVPRRR